MTKNWIWWALGGAAVIGLGYWFLRPAAPAPAALPSAASMPAVPPSSFSLTQQEQLLTAQTSPSPAPSELDKVREQASFRAVQRTFSPQDLPGLFG